MHQAFELSANPLLAAGGMFCLGQSTSLAAEEGGDADWGGVLLPASPGEEASVAFTFFCTPFLNPCKRLI